MWCIPCQPRRCHGTASRLISCLISAQKPHLQRHHRQSWFLTRLMGDEDMRLFRGRPISMRFQTFLAPSDSCAVSDVPCARFRSLAGTGTLPTGAAWQTCLCAPASLSCFSLNFTSCVCVCVCVCECYCCCCCCCCYVFLSCSDGACEFWSNCHTVDVSSSPGACDFLSAATLLGSVLPGQNVFPEICLHAEILKGGLKKIRSILRRNRVRSWRNEFAQVAIFSRKINQVDFSHSLSWSLCPTTIPVKAS